MYLFFFFFIANFYCEISQQNAQIRAGEIIAGENCQTRLGAYRLTRMRTRAILYRTSVVIGVLITGCYKDGIYLTCLSSFDGTCDGQREGRVPRRSRFRSPDRTLAGIEYAGVCIAG